MMKKAIPFVFLILLALKSYGSTKDSLTNKLNELEENDSTYIKTLRELTYYYLFEENNVSEAIKITNKAIQIAKSNKLYLWTGKMYAVLGYIKQGFSTEYDEAIKANFEALKYYDIAKNTLDKYTVYLNLGTLYYDYHQLEDAEKYLLLAENIARESDLPEDLALVQSNLGALYNEIHKSEKSSAYFKKARKYYADINDEFEVARIDFSLTNLVCNQKDISISSRKKSIEDYLRVKEVFKAYEQWEFYLGTLINLGLQYNKTGNYAEAEKNLIEAEKLAIKDKNYKLLISIYSTLAENAFLVKSYQKQAEYLQRVIGVSDSSFTENKAKAISEVQIKYQTDKIESENEILTKETEIKDLEISKKDIEIAQSNTIRFALIGGLTLIIIFSGFLFNRFQVINKQKKTIEFQKAIVDEKQKEITDSIKYAKRLQEAILPSEKLIRENLPNSFLIYRPKDIVAGDFYFFEKKNEEIFIAAADCTGHGVPGAMVSVVCSNALTRSIKEFDNNEPGKILDTTRELVVATFDKSGQDVKDGMDIALCSLKDNVLKFSGANNPLWIIRNNELIVGKANKQPVGKYYNAKPYDTFTIELMKNDTVYLFTDGYNDQFGGEKGKKFKAKAFFELLLSVQNKPMEDQAIIINTTFDNWKANLEQVDDVCIIGFKYS